MKETLHRLNFLNTSKVDLDLELENLEKSFEVELIKNYGLLDRQEIRTKFSNSQVTNDKSGNNNLVVESFIVAFILLFSALEEADWLCFSANSQIEDIVDDKTCWNVFRLFSLMSSPN